MKKSDSIDLDKIMRAPSENISKKTLNTRKRMQKHRMRKEMLIERQNLVRDQLQEGVDSSSAQQAIPISMPHENKRCSLVDELRGWSKKHNISAGAITHLLKILICYG